MTLFETVSPSVDTVSNINQAIDKLEKQAREKLPDKYHDIMALLPALETFEPHTEQWYAAEILFRCWTVRDSIEKNDAARAAWEMLVLMERVENSNIDGFEKQIRVGQNSIGASPQNARDQRTSNNIQRDKDICALNTKMLGEGAGSAAIRNAVKDKYNISKTQFYKIIGK